ncbi:MAG: DUF2087 domain-containing protein [Propionicimonas sp.]|uniref:DUF2087 domain-containing protein n=1 Tax=Propionicimonas sp. TaxID=1955623 RepID=UPI002B1F343F|nr:DUF2087 domain-containing protein [Propionicimonas sp.]MEA4945102.1 DUF2087 domain-containing protein [Propionicimonas sp.]MEA5053603.1 DUF2087 domain-containing protein [Propionicimonas sp.]
MEWRTVIAMLANPDTRRALARVVAETEATPSGQQAQRGLARLAEAGLVRDGVVDVDALRALLQENARPRPEGAERFLSPSGRLIGLPSRPGDRQELLRLIATRVLVVGEVVTEKELGERLAAFDDDVATLRRLLVEAELLERTPTGTEYALVVEDGSTPSGS